MTTNWYQLIQQQEQKTEQIFERIEKRFDKFYAQLIDAALAETVGILKYDASGRIKNTSSLPLVLAAIKKVVNRFQATSYTNSLFLINRIGEIRNLDKEYIYRVTTSTRNRVDNVYKRVAKQTASNYGISFTKEGDIKFKKDTFLGNLSIGNHIKRTLENTLAQGISGGLNTDEVRQLLQTQTKRNVQSEITHKAMEQLRTESKEVGAEFGLTKYFMYVGNRKRDSRCFCVGGADYRGRGKNKRVVRRHADKRGKVFTLEEIMLWQNQQWNGKSTPYNPFKDVGGYNCGHKLLPVSEEIARSRRPDLFG